MSSLYCMVLRSIAGSGLAPATRQCHSRTHVGFRSEHVRSEVCPSTSGHMQSMYVLHGVLLQGLSVWKG